jgi:RHS repeat-associated protein
MSICRKTGLADPDRVVGDPVDVVTGANTDCQLDFRLAGPVPLYWRRYYDSSRNTILRVLGWGHTHELDRNLQFDLDGIRYMGPDGRIVGFPLLERDRDRTATAGWTIRRLDAMHYVLQTRDGPAYEFEFRNTNTAAFLRRLSRGRASISLRYDVTGRLQSVIDSLGRPIRFEYQGDGRLTGLFLQDRRSGEERRILAYEYDQSGNLVRGTDPYGHSFSFSWDEQNHLVSKTDRRGYSFFFQYDSSGRCIHSKGQDGLLEVALEYRPAEYTTIVTRADGGRWSYFCDEAGRISKILDPVGGVRSFSRDEHGRVVGETDVLGRVTRYVYDDAGALVSKISPLGRRYAAEEPPPPSYPSHWVAEFPFEYEYGRLTMRRRFGPPKASDSDLRDLPADVRGFMTFAVPAAPEAAPETEGREGLQGVGLQEYDNIGNLIRQRFDDGSQRSWTYDANGNVARLHDRDGATRSYEYVSWNLPRKVIDGLGHATFFWHTSDEQVSRVTDAGGATSEYDYDAAGRVVRVRRSGSVRDEYSWDPAGSLLEKRDGSGNRLVMLGIGEGGRPSTRTLASGERQEFAYDAAGRFLRVATPGADVLFAYDEFGNRTKDQRGGRGVMLRYDAIGPREVAILGRFRVGYERAPEGGLIVSEPTGHRLRVHVDTDSGVVARTFGNGVVAEYSQYDEEGRCRFKALRRLPGPWWTRRYRYSGEGDLLEVEDSRAGTTRYSYDASHRLISWQPPGSAPRRFVYDRAGNLVEQPGMSTATVLDGNRLGTVGDETLEYDARSNIAARSRSDRFVRYFYDSRGLLIGCDLGGESWTAEYDALGRRVAKTWRGQRHEYYWNTDQLAAEVSPEGRVRVYVYAHPYALVPMLFVDYETVDADPASGRRYFVFTDHNGTASEVWDDDGRVVWSASGEPYGAKKADPSSTIDFALRFPGHYCDDETGLYYNRFRYYSPELGRYLQPDPLGVIAGSVNLYAYAGGNPVTRVDVRGLTCPNHPETTDPNCEDCQDNEPTQIIQRPPDPETTDACGPATPPWSVRDEWGEGVRPDEAQIVRPGQPLELEPGTKYLYAVDEQGNVIVAPERGSSTMPDGSSRRTTHVDLLEGEPGRCSGELIPVHDSDGNPTNMFLMNDDSGRYSNSGPPDYSATRSPENLQGANQLLQDSGTGDSTIYPDHGGRS